MLGNDALLAYPDFSKPFDVYLDASDYQLGAMVVQNGRPLGFYTRKRYWHLRKTILWER